MDRDIAEREAMDAIRLFQIHQGRDEYLAEQAALRWRQAMEQLNRQAA